MIKKVVVIALTTLILVGCQSREEVVEEIREQSVQEEIKQEAEKYREYKERYNASIKPLVDDMYTKINEIWENKVTESTPVQELTLKDINEIVVAYSDLINNEEYNTLDITGYGTKFGATISGLLFNLESIAMERIYALEIVMSTEELTEDDKIKIEEHIQMAENFSNAVKLGVETIEIILE